MEKLTSLEIKLLNGMRKNEYNDAIEWPTWSFAAIDNSGVPATKARGVISSLVQKGLVVVEPKTKDEPESIGFTEKGKALFNNADGEENTGWGGPRLLKEIEKGEVLEASTAKKKAVKESKVKEVTVIAFTGMEIGTFKVTSETKEEIGITTAKGAKLTFNKATKIQTNAKSHRFANKLK